MKRRPIDTAAEQRYWRRRANRRVRKKRRTRSLLRLAWLLGVNGAIAATLIYAGARVVLAVRGSDEFQLRRVEIVGAQRADAGEIEQSLSGYLGRNLFDLDLGEIERVARLDSWVLAAAVRRRLPDTIELDVTERTPCARALIRGVIHVVDHTGYVLGPAGSDLADDLPVLTGLDGASDEALIASLRRGVRLVDALRRADRAFAATVSELDLSRRDRLAVRTVSGTHRLLLDPQRAERNLHRYLEFIAEIEDRVGPLRYVDLRWRDQIAVMPAINIHSREGR